jgi:hypothetical protein
MLIYFLFIGYSCTQLEESADVSKLSHKCLVTVNCNIKILDCAIVIAVQQTGDDFCEVRPAITFSYKLINMSCQISCICVTPCPYCLWAQHSALYWCLYCHKTDNTSNVLQIQCNWHNSEEHGFSRDWNFNSSRPENWISCNVCCLWKYVCRFAIERGLAKL